MYEILLKFGIGLIILLFCTQKLVELAKKVSRIFRISPLIIGITIVAIGTSLPELAVSVISVIKHDAGLALGNIIGSNIINVLMVFPLGLFIGKLRIGTSKTQRNALILLGVTGIFLITQFLGKINSISGVSLISLAIIVSIIEYRLGVFGRTHEDAKQFKKIVNERLSINLIALGLFLVLGIIGGGIIIVDSVEAISLLTGISTTILGLTLTAVATSLPELFTTIFSQEDNQEKITVGNIIGSNIYNLLLVGGIVCLFPLASVIQAKEWVWLSITTVGFVAILRFYRGQKPPRMIGVVLILLFIIYIVTQQ